MFNNKTILITGGTGSFGNAVLNRFLTTDIGVIRTLSCDEKKQDVTLTSRIDARVDVLGDPNTLRLLCTSNMMLLEVKPDGMSNLPI